MMTYIIARYNEDISWSNNLNPKLIVQKDEHLPNKGREASSYLWYIINHYDNLEGIYCFRQGKAQTHDVAYYKHTSDHNGSPDHPGLPIKAFSDRIQLDIPDQLKFTAGAQFDCPANKIKLRSLDWYKTVYSVCMSDEFSQPAHILERLWKYIFNL